MMGLQLDPQRMRFASFVIFLVALVIVLFLIAPLIWSMLQIFIIAILLTLALDAPVHWQVQRGVPRWAATLNLIFLLIVVIIAALSFLIPPVVQQSKALLADLPTLWSQAMRQVGSVIHQFPDVERSLSIHQLLRDIFSGAESWSIAARSIFATAFGAVTSVLIILVSVFYLLLNPWPLLYGARGCFPQAWWPDIDRLASLIAMRIRSWVVGTIVLAVIIGILDYLALLLINTFRGPNVPFILFFAMLGAMLEVVPILGPIISSVLPALVGFAIDPVLGILVLLAFFIIQQLESNVITPLVMHKAVELHPVSLIFVLVVLTGLFGIFGALISVPFGSVLKILYDEWYYPLIHQGEHPQPPPEENHLEAAPG